MRSERGQATVEWIGILLLVALALAALARLAPHADGKALATTVAHSISQPAARPTGSSTDPPPPRAEAFTAPLLVPRPGRPLGAPLRLPRVPARIARGAGTAWRRAWYACLVYERFRWAFLHPESRFPGYTMPPSEVLRIMNDCISPVDLVRDWSMLQGGAR